MSLTNDIQRILWHEMGHFCVDIQKPNHHAEYYVNKLSIQYEKRNDDLISWKGCVEMLPSIKWPLIPKDDSFMAYSLISLVSACIFETTYFTKILKEKRTLENCFSINKTVLGNKDYHHYHEIVSQTRKLHDYFRGHEDVNKFLEFDYIDIVKEMIDTKNDFHQALVKIIDPITTEIKKDFISKNSPSPYSYDIMSDSLDGLREGVLEISDGLGFTDSVAELRKILMDKYNSYIEKYVPSEE